MAKVKTKTGLRDLQISVFEKAIEKIKPTTPSEEWELRLLTEDMHAAAVVFMRDFFVQHEPLALAFEVQWDEDAESYWRAVFKHGMSLILTKKTDRSIIAIRGLEIIDKSDRICTENISDQRLKDLLEYLNYCDGHAEFFEHYGCDEAIHFSGLAVHVSFRRKGIATFMLTSAVDFISNLDLESVFVKGEASSNYSKRIYEKLGFELLFEQRYEEYRANGRKVMHNIGEHKSNKVYGKHIKKIQYGRRGFNGWLTQTDIEKAFQKTTEETEVPFGKPVLVTEDLYRKAVEISKQCFIDDEPIGKSIGIEWSDEFESIWLDTFAAGLSVMLLNDENGDAIGFRAIRLLKKSEKFDIETLRDDKLRKVLRFITLGTDDFFAKYGIEQAFHFLGLGVAKEYRRRGIGTFLMRFAMKFLENLGIRPYHIKSEGTSNFSKKIYEKCGFDTIAHYPYDEYMENGKVVFDNTGEHKSMKVFGMCLRK